MQKMAGVLMFWPGYPSNAAGFILFLILALLQRRGSGPYAVKPAEARSA